MSQCLYGLGHMICAIWYCSVCLISSQLAQHPPTLRDHPSAGLVQDPVTENIHPSKVSLNKTLFLDEIQSCCLVPDAALWHDSVLWAKQDVKKLMWHAKIRAKKGYWLIAAAVPEGVVSGSRGRASRRGTGGRFIRILCLQTTITRSEEQQKGQKRVKCKKIWDQSKMVGSGKWSRQRKEDQGRSSLLFETCVPDNLEDIADSSFFLWDVQTIWTRPRHEVVLAAVVRHKLERGGRTKHSTMNYTNMMSGSYCLGQFYGMLGCVYVFTVPLSSPLYYLQVVWGWWCLPSHPTHHSAPSEKPHRMAPPMV